MFFGIAHPFSFSFLLSFIEIRRKKNEKIIKHGSWIKLDILWIGLKKEERIWKRTTIVIWRSIQKKNPIQVRKVNNKETILGELGFTYKPIPPVPVPKTSLLLWFVGSKANLRKVFPSLKKVMIFPVLTSKSFCLSSKSSCKLSIWLLVFTISFSCRCIARMASSSFFASGALNIYL